MRCTFLLLAFAVGVSAQSMLEAGGITAGTAVGSAAGKKLSDAVDSNLRRTSTALEKAADQGSKQTQGSKQAKDNVKGKQASKAAASSQSGSGVPAPPRATRSNSVPSAPPLQIGTGAPRSGGYNVPPPPPRKHSAPPVQARRAAAPPPDPIFIEPPAPPPPPLNVDLAGIAQGMKRDELLALGMPSSRLTMSEDGHVVEIYHYHNQTLASGTVHLLDGSVAQVETRD